MALGKLGYLAKIAISKLQKHDSSHGANLLEIGLRYGIMAILFSLIGTKVTAVDIQKLSLGFAREELM